MKKYKILATFAVMILAAWWGWYSYQVNLYTGLIPKKFELDRVMWIDGKTGLLSGCGIAAFYLSDNTIKKVKNEGLTFFDNVIIARNPHPNTHSDYNKWQEMPLPKETADGFPLIGMGCSDDLSKEWKNKIYSATKQAGNYYSHDSGWGTLMVFPTLKIIVLDYYD